MKMSAKNDFARSEHGKIKRGRGTISDLLKLPLGNSRCRILGPRYRNASATARQRRNGRSACMDQGGAINAPVPSPPKNTTTTTTTTTTWSSCSKRSPRPQPPRRPPRHRPERISPGRLHNAVHRPRAHVALPAGPGGKRSFIEEAELVNREGARLLLHEGGPLQAEMQLPLEAFGFGVQALEVGEEVSELCKVDGLGVVWVGEAEELF